MAVTAARRAFALTFLAACLPGAVHAAELNLEPANVPSGKPGQVHIIAPGPGAAMLIAGGPHITATLTLPGNRIMAFDPARHLGYRANTKLLEVVDLRAPGEVVGQYAAGRPIVGIKSQASEILLSLDDGQVVGLDPRAPGAPALRRQVRLPNAGRGVAALSQYLFQATGGNELLIWDTADPARPQLVARHGSTGPIYDVDLAEGRAYVAQGDAGLLILDVQDPTRPLWLGSTGQLGKVVKVVARGDSVWVASDDGTISRIDTFNAAQPSFNAKQTLPARPVQALAVADDEAWAATSDHLYRIAFDAEPPPTGNAGLDIGRGVNYGGQRRADVVGKLVYVADWFSGLHIYDVGDPARPRLLASLKTPGSAKGVVVRGRYAYVADDDHGLQIVDVRDPRAPRIVAHLATPGLAYTPKLSGDLLYLSSHRGGFQIIDVSKPTAPRLVADVPTPGMAWSLAVAGNTLYVADDAAGLLIYDVRHPAAPRAVAAFNPGGRLEEVLVRKGIAYLAYFDQGLRVLDVSAPEHPKVLAELATPGNARGLDLEGNTLYVADWLAGVHIVDVADPAAPTLRRSYDTPGAAWGVRVRGQNAYVLDWWGGFGVLNLLGDPPTLARYAELGSPQQDAAEGDYLYVAHGDSGLQIFDIKNPLNPTWITGVELPRAAQRVVLAAGAAYVGLAGGGLAAIDIGQPFGARLVKVVKTARPLVSLQVAGGRLYAQAAEQAWVFDLARPLDPKLAGHTTGKLGSVWAAGGRIYAAFGSREWQRAGVQASELPHPAALLRGQGEVLAAIDADHPNAISLYKLDDGRVEKLGGLTLGHRVSDLAWGDGVLYVSSDMGLVTLNVSDPARPEIVAIQEGFADGPEMIIHRGVLYSGLTALKPVPPLTAVVDELGAVDMVLPADLPVGGYDLVFKPVQGHLLARQNALKVETARFSKPNITPEEFQRLLQQYRQNEGNTPATQPAP